MLARMKHPDFWRGSSTLLLGSSTLLFGEDEAPCFFGEDETPCFLVRIETERDRDRERLRGREVVATQPISLVVGITYGLAYPPPKMRSTQGKKS